MHFAAQEDYKTRRQVVAANPGAAKIVKVCGGWMIFDYATDYEVWREQE